MGGLSADQRPGRSSGRFLRRPMNQAMNRSINQPLNWLLDRLLNRLANPLPGAPVPLLSHGPQRRRSLSPTSEIAKPRQSRIRRQRPHHLVGPRQRRFDRAVQHRHLTLSHLHLSQQRRAVKQLLGGDMDDLMLALADLLHPPPDLQQRGRQHRPTILLEPVRPDHQIGDPGLVLEGDEDHPRADPGRCRTSTIPASLTSAPSGRSHSACAGTRPAALSRSRTSAIGCALSESRSAR